MFPDSLFCALSLEQGQILPILESWVPPHSTHLTNGYVHMLAASLRVGCSAWTSCLHFVASQSIDGAPQITSGSAHVRSWHISGSAHVWSWHFQHRWRLPVNVLLMLLCLWQLVLTSEVLQRHALDTKTCTLGNILSQHQFRTDSESLVVVSESAKHYDLEVQIHTVEQQYFEVALHKAGRWCSAQMHSFWIRDVGSGECMDAMDIENVGNEFIW